MLEQRTDRDIGDLLGDITHNLERLVRGEIHLVKAGAVEWARGVSRGAVLLVVGSLLALLTAGLALTAAVVALAAMMPAWQAALIVAAGVGLIAMVTIAIGVKAVSRPVPKPGIEIFNREDGGRGTDNR